MEEVGKPLTIRDLPIPTDLGPDDVLIKTRACGICGTDLHICQGVAYVPDLPRILGHEIAGVVSKVGTNVRHLILGQRVVAYIFITCGQCYYCRVGRDSQCVNLQGAMGVMNDGGFAEYVKVPAQNLFVLPDSVHFEAGALIADALLTAVHALRRTRIRQQDTAVVIGAGGVGQCLIPLLCNEGVKVVATARSKGKLEIAKKMGAHLILQSDTPDIIDRIKDFSGGFGAQCVFDCVGSGPTMKASADFACNGGQIIVIGEEPDFPEIDTIQIAQRELEIIGSRNGTKQDMIDSVKIVAAGIVKPEITRTFTLDEINQAFDFMRSGQAAGRVVIVYK